MSLRDSLKESSLVTEDDYISSVRNFEKIRDDIEGKLHSLDNLELFARIFLFKTLFDPRRHLEEYKELKKTDFFNELDDVINSPNFLFAIGLSLKKTGNGKTDLTVLDHQNFLFQLNDFFNEYLKSSFYKLVLSKDIDEGLIASSRLHYMINQTNRERYKFQTDELLTETLSHFNPFFLERFGFDINDAKKFSQTIIENFGKNVEERLEECQKITKDQENFEIKLQETLFTNSKKMIEIIPTIFCENYNNSEIEKFQKYLDQISCCFGDGNPNYSLPIHDNIILERPLIKYSSKYYAVDPSLLYSHLPEIFTGFLESEKQTNPKIWDAYLELRSKFTEEKVRTCFSRIFPEKGVYSNLFYDFKDPSPDETDHIIPYYDNILIIEDKSGRYTVPARRGGKNRIKRHLKDLVEDSYIQGLRCRDYIKSRKNAIFKNKKRQTVLTIHYKKSTTNFILINVTLEHLYNFSSVDILRSLGMFSDEEYLWSISIFDLDLITQYFSSPTIFIHYIESRILAPLFFAFEELSFLGYYLDQGNFTVYPIDGKIPRIMITPEHLVKFDEYYLQGGEKPELKIEDEFLKILLDLERIMPENHREISNAFLDLRHDLRDQLIKGIKRSAYRTSIDGQRHDTMLYGEMINTGISVITNTETENLRDDLLLFCKNFIKKYHAKSWIGIGIDILDTQHYACEFVYVEC